MMKTRKGKVANLLKTGIFFLGISLLLWNCEPENELSQETLIIQKENLISKHITFKEIPEIINTIKNKFLLAKNSNTSLNLNYNNILEITDSLEAKTYSFKFNKVYNEEYFANIIVQKNNDGTIEPPLVYKYIPTEEFNIEYIKGNKDITDFTGEVEMYYLDNFLISHNNQTKSKSAFNGGPCGAVDIFGINNNNGHNSTGGSTGGGVTCEVRKYVTSCSCKGDLVGVHDHQQTTVIYEVTCKKNYSSKASFNDSPCGGGGNNGSITVGVNEPAMIPCFDSSNCEEEYISNVLNNIPNLNQSQINWVTNLKNIRTIFKISELIDANNKSFESKLFAKQAIALEMTLSKPLQVKQTGQVPSELASCCPGGCCPSSDYDNDLIIKEYGIQPVQAVVDGTFNVFISTASLVGSDSWVGKNIRRIMTEIGMSIPNDVTNEHLAAIFKIRKRNGVVIVEYREGILGTMLDFGLNTLDMISFLTPSKGGGAFLASKIGGISITKMTQHLRNISINNVKVDNLVNTLTPKARFELNGTGKYKDVGGHHPLAKKSFESDAFYKYREAFSVPNSKIDAAAGIPNIHSQITGQQNSLYSAFAKSNEVLTLDKIAEIEIKSMTNVGIPEDVATGWVIKALENLKSQGVKVITHIPWNGIN